MTNEGGSVTPRRPGRAVELSDEALLEVWGRSRAMGMPDRASVILRAALGVERPDCDGLPVGHRDALLLDARKATFGPTVEGVTGCPGCGAQLEIAFDLEEIRLPGPPAETTLEVSTGSPPWRLRIRLPTNGDLRAATSASDSGTARRVLAERCVLEARRSGRRVSPAALPDDVLSKIGRALAEADPQADVRFALACPECGHAWEARFDVLSFLWRELDARARRLVLEIHTLALAYGWREADVLAVPTGRRRAFLELLGA